MIYENKKVIVCGMARSGVSAAKLLASIGADVTLQDIKPLEALIKLHDIEGYKKSGIKIYAGANPEDIIEGFDYAVLSPGIPCDLPFIKKAGEAGVKIITSSPSSIKA